jgi:hypothetical protein
MSLTPGFAGHGSHRPGTVCLECDRLASSPGRYQALIAASIEGAFEEAGVPIPPLLQSELNDIAFGLSAAVVTGMPLTLARVRGETR